MAGFVDYNVDGTTKGLKGNFGVSKTLRKLASLGMSYDDMVIKNSKAIGPTEADIGNSGYMPSDFLYSLMLSDIGQKKYIAYFDKSIKARRDYLRKFAMNSEIEFITETIADEAVVYDSRNFFCKPDVQNLRKILKDEVEPEIVNYVWDSFNKIYYAHHFVEGYDAWSYFKQFLIDGFLAFEIVWDAKAENIIGFKELDPLSIRPGIAQAENGSIQKVWVQYEDNPSMKRELYDSQVIYISYAKSNFTNRTSYVERLIRSFNLLRIMENSRVIWNIMNASFRMKMVVPIGTKSPQKAKESLAELMSVYKEDINLDMDSGELSVNGKPSMQFYKNYLFPSKNGESPEIETLGADGYDLSDTDALSYFKNKLRDDSKVPYERFDKQNGGGSWTNDATSMNREEIRFSRFINRLRSVFQEIILKPLLLQAQVKYPELKDDMLFKSSIGLDWEEDNLFKESKEMEIMNKRVDFVNNMMGLMVDEIDDSGMVNEIKYFDGQFLAEKYLKLSNADLQLNQKYKTRRKLGLDVMTGKATPKLKSGEGEGQDNNESEPDMNLDLDI